eukprot:106950_1
MTTYKLNKYQIADVTFRNHTSCELFCNTLIDTQSLASIHSLRDFNEAKNICFTEEISKICWIGLHDTETQNIWKWYDDSTLDYGYNISGGVFPWYDGQPSGEHCVQIQPNQQYEWDDKKCELEKLCLCTQPSILCPSISTWTTISGNIFIASCSWQTLYSGHQAITDKQWHNTDGELWIDYMYAIEMDSSSSNGNCGIMIYNAQTGSFCTYYHIYVQSNKTNHNLVLSYVSDLESTILSNQILKLDLVLDASVYYLLSVRISGYNFTIYFNDIHHISFVHENIAVLNNGDSGFIGLKMDGMYKSNAMYLYVSGMSFNVLTPLDTNEICLTKVPSLATFPPSLSPIGGSNAPSLQPSHTPLALTNIPSQPTFMPLFTPSHTPFATPTNTPTSQPTFIPSFTPFQPIYTNAPTFQPIYSDFPSFTPTQADLSGSINHPLLTYSTEIEIKSIRKPETDNSGLIVIYVLAALVLCCIIVFIMFVVTRKIKDKNVSKSNETQLSNTGTVGMDMTRVNSASSMKSSLDNKVKNDFNLQDNDVEISPGNEAQLSNVTRVNSDSSMKSTLGNEINVHVTQGGPTSMLQSDGINNLKNWLITIGLPQYLEYFVSNGYESMEFVKEIVTEEQLYDIGIVKKDHQVKILAEIKRLDMVIQYENEPSIEIIGDDEFEDEGHQTVT